MPATYEPIATTTLGSAQSDVTFSSIPQTYTDLIMIVTGTNASGISNSDFVFQFNGDTGSNYSRTYLYGNGSSAISGRETNFANGVNLIGLDSTTTGAFIVQLLNYTNTTTNKTILSRYNLLSSGVAAVVGLWRSTAAINSIKIYNTAGRTIASGSTFTLYGIKSA